MKKSSKIVLTGGSGFLGSNFINTFSSKSKSLLLFNSQEHNLHEVESLKSLLSGTKVIVHLAGANRDTDVNLFKVNVLGTWSLLESISRYASGATIIFSSSFQVYDPENIYGFSKKIAEEFIEYYARKKKVKAIILRISNIYGPHGKPFYNSVVATFVHQIKNGNAITINGDGMQKRDYIYIDDVVDAIIKAIDYNPKNDIEYFDICSGKLTSLNKIINELKNISMKPVKVRYKKLMEKESKSKQKKLLKEKKLFGWNPKTKLSHGLKKTFNVWE